MLRQCSFSSNVGPSWTLILLIRRKRRNQPYDASPSMASERSRNRSSPKPLLSLQRRVGLASTSLSFSRALGAQFSGSLFRFTRSKVRCPVPSKLPHGKERCGVQNFQMSHLPKAFKYQKQPKARVGDRPPRGNSWCWSHPTSTQRPGRQFHASEKVNIHSSGRRLPLGEVLNQPKAARASVLFWWPARTCLVRIRFVAKIHLVAMAKKSCWWLFRKDRFGSPQGTRHLPLAANGYVSKGSNMVA